MASRTLSLLLVSFAHLHDLVFAMCLAAKDKWYTVSYLSTVCLVIAHYKLAFFNLCIILIDVRRNKFCYLQLYFLNIIHYFHSSPRKVCKLCDPSFVKRIKNVYSLVIDFTQHSAKKLFRGLKGHLVCESSLSYIPETSTIQPHHQIRFIFLFEHEPVNRHLFKSSKETVRVLRALKSHSKTNLINKTYRVISGSQLFEISGIPVCEKNYFSLCNLCVIFLICGSIILITWTYLQTLVREIKLQ